MGISSDGTATGFDGNRAMTKGFTETELGREDEAPWVAESRLLDGVCAGNEQTTKIPPVSVVGVWLDERRRDWRCDSSSSCSGQGRS
ncbi:unnamed protein product [Linum trigynum]|uniref:Uncharacterized protein n=1 Tax=Linum trigynum TaxID=586398 RepID=A0AAV2CWA9_9ROSI